MISLRAFLATIGAVAVVAGCLGLFLPISVGDSVSCGTAVSLDTGRAESVDKFTSLAPYVDDTLTATDCRSAATLRKAWGIPTAIIGAIVLLGALLVRSPRQSPN